MFYPRDDEDPVDQKKYLEERCKPQCVKSLYEYEKCVKRVENDDTGHKHCTGQYFDYWSCIDKCVSTCFQITLIFVTISSRKTLLS
ncbi:hypothetical protein C2845_PM18G01260 [Panicum miliaceum]|uniref:Complex III subunit VI n=1 Tax=Panicum miliaceum TaxID=4540 RepID=A0A3L6PJK7_PANMI|nr:hypothetical protein C2845_PM18G01260 [Panicum miliaceum]